MSIIFQSALSWTHIELRSFSTRTLLRLNVCLSICLKLKSFRAASLNTTRNDEFAEIKAPQSHQVPSGTTRGGREWLSEWAEGWSGVTEGQRIYYHVGTEQNEPADCWVLNVAMEAKDVWTQPGVPNKVAGGLFETCLQLKKKRGLHCFVIINVQIDLTQQQYKSYNFSGCFCSPC